MASAPLPIQPLRKPFDVTIDDLPGSKSLTNRALLLAALAKGTSTLTNVLFSDDTRIMMDALTKLGFMLKIDETARIVVIEGQAGNIPSKTVELFLGNAGTAYRFLTAACCLGAPGSVYTLDGAPRMRERPIGQLVDHLRQLGANIRYLNQEGYPPLRITAQTIGGETLLLKPTLSSQYISALLQIGPYCSGGLDVQFEGPITSEPYVRMTTGLMRCFGVTANWHDNHLSVVGMTNYCACIHDIEPDASNASYFLAAAAITPGSKIVIKGLKPGSLQGDARFIFVLAGMRAGTLYQRDDNISIRSPMPSELRGITSDLNHMPDMAQTLAAVALFAEGDTVIRNIGNLRVKETDRLAALKNELTKLGAGVEIDGDDLFITPPPGNRIRPAAIDTYDDHRMAMSFAVVGLAAEGTGGVTINDPACVNKTFPTFFEYLERLRM